MITTQWLNLAEIAGCDLTQTYLWSDTAIGQIQKPLRSRRRLLLTG
jgi:hypothetical protein